MVEISFWHPGDEKTRVIYTTDSLDDVIARIRYVNEGVDKFASFSHPTSEGKVYIPSSVVRECVVIVTAVVEKPAKGVLL